MKSLHAFGALQEALEEVKQRHFRLSDPTAPPAEDRLSKLIARILATPIAEHPEVARSLTDDDATILVHAFELDLSPENLATIGAVMAMRPLPRQLVQAWIVLRNHPTTKHLHKTMRGISAAIGDGVLASDSTLSRLGKIWGAEHLPTSLVADLAAGEETVRGWCESDWGAGLEVKPESPLALAMRGFVLAYGERSVLLRHQLVELSAWFEDIIPSSLELSAQNYIRQLESSEWDWARILEWVGRYGLPAKRKPFWEKVEKSKRDEIQRKIAGDRMRDFFGSAQDPAERFKFWEGYSGALIDLAFPRNRERVFMEFRGVVVVEFRDIGNAGYIYDASYASVMKKLVASDCAHAKCKDKNAARHRILHQSSWQANARRYLSRALAEG
jgi:hypothetical protein